METRMTRGWFKPLLMMGAVLLMSTAAGAAAPAVEGDHATPRTDVIGPAWAGIVPAVTTLVVFVLLLIVLSKFAWGPIASGLKAREDKIRRDIEEAEAARARAEATLNEYRQQLAGAEDRIRQMMAAATADAERAAETIRMRGRQEAEEIKEKANRDIEASRDEAIREIYAQAADLSTDIAEKIIRRELRPEDQKALVDESLGRLQAVR
jgi:F-type H+-transporting ATPase subunit b